jgi:hypothetical protein
MVPMIGLSIPPSTNAPELLARGFSVRNDQLILPRPLTRRKSRMIARTATTKPAQPRRMEK